MDEKPTDDDLVRRYKNGEIKAFDELYERYHRLVFHICYNRLENTEDAEDAAQIAFMKIASKIYQYQEPGNFRAWLGMLTRNTCRDAVKSSPKIVFTDCEFDSIAVDKHNPSMTVEDKDMTVKLLEHISELDEPAKTIICERIIYKMPVKDIAISCSISVKHVYRIYEKTLKEIRKKFKP